jgi:hypothetical protein
MANERKIQTGAGREPYPAVRQDDAIERIDETKPAAAERRSFAPGGATSPIDESWLGPRGDPAEGKR